MSGRKKRESLQDKVLEYFRLVDPRKNQYKCLIDNCKRDCLSGARKFNLVSHARTQHKYFFDQTFGKDVIAVKKYPLPYRRLKYIQRCVEIVAVNGNPFTKLHESGVYGLLEDELEVLKMYGFAKGLGHPNYVTIKKQIAYLSGELQNEIKSEVCGKFVAVMVDTASKYDMSILGVSIQYMYEGQLKIRTIGMINLTEPQTALHLKDVIIDRLQVYGINKHQIISLTTDNANSMLSMVKLMNDHPTNDNEIIDDEDEDTEDDDEDDSDEEYGGQLTPETITRLPFDMNIQGLETLDNVIQQCDAEISVCDSESDDDDRRNEVNGILNETDEFDELLKELQQNFSAYTMHINGIRCAAHTVQLAVQDALDTDDMKTLLKKCKKLCKLLRKKKVRFILRTHNIRIKLPRLDCKTRWNSKFRMVINKY